MWCERLTLKRRVQVAATAFVLAFLAILPSSAADISYVYDDAGRLRAVIDPATNTAIYAYDAVGNLTGITQQAASTLVLLQATPASDPVGTTVTIYGTGFSATPASNTVKFNGTTATVLTASTTVLTATVPSGATTGSISVTVGANTATSAASFTVGSGVPTLSSFSPAVGSYGATVTLTGTNYDTTLINDRVAFAGAMGAVATATSTNITVPVPSTAQTGPLSVSTIQGTATSSTEFYVAPPGVVATDVQYTGRVTVDGSTVAASITTANKTGLMVFDGTAGQRVSLGFSGVTVTQFTASVYRPDGVAMIIPVPTFSLSGGSVDLGVLPLTGTYTIVLDPVSTSIGTITVTVSTELTGTITPGGAAVPISISRVGQNARYTFAGTSGQTISLGVTAVTMIAVTLSILKPDGSTLVAPTSFGTSGGAIDSQVLPSSGTYAILIDPYIAYTGNVTLTLYNQPDVTGTIIIDGATVTPSLTVPGQRARYTLSGTAGQWVNLGLTGVTITSSNVSIFKPDGSTLASTGIGTAGGSLDPVSALPTTDTYTIVVDPSGLATGTMTLTLTSPLIGTITHARRSRCAAQSHESGPDGALYVQRHEWAVAEPGAHLRHDQFQHDHAPQTRWDTTGFHDRGHERRGTRTAQHPADDRDLHHRRGSLRNEHRDHHPHPHVESLRHVEPGRHRHRLDPFHRGPECPLYVYGNGGTVGQSRHDGRDDHLVHHHIVETRWHLRGRNDSGNSQRQS